MKKIIFTIIAFCLLAVNCFADLNTITSEIENLKSESLKKSPDLNILLEKKQQSQIATYNDLTQHLPKAYFNIKKQKDFFESTSPLLKSLGLTTANYLWGIDYQWSLYNQSLFLNSKKSFNQKNIDQINYEIGIKDYEVQFKVNLLKYILSLYKEVTIANSIKKAETQKREAKLGFDLGQKTKIDVLRSEANYVSLTSKKISYEDEVKNSLNKFVEKTGLKHENLEFLKNLGETELISLIENLSKYHAIKEKINTEDTLLFEKLVLNKDLENINATYLTQSEWPELKIQGSYTNSADTLNNTLHTPTRAHSVALVLTIPIFSGGSIVTSNFEQYHLKKQIAYKNEKELIELDHNLKNSIIKVKALESLVESLKINVDQFEELYRLTSKSYSLGKSTLFELLEVQDNLLDSKINLASNKISLYELAETFNWQSDNK